MFPEKLYWVQVALCQQLGGCRGSLCERRSGAAPCQFQLALQWSTAGHSSACQRHWWYLWENVLKKRQNAERKRTTQRPKQQEGHHRRTATTPKGLRAMDGPLSVEEMTMKKGAAEEKSEEQGATE